MANIQKWTYAGFRRFLVRLGLLTLCLSSFDVVADTSLVAAVLPSSRSVQVGTPATIFATVINAGSEVAIGCRIESDSRVAGEFLYQTTNPATNAPMGPANTSVDLLAGQAQTFVLAITAEQARSPIEFAPQFVCDNAPEVTPITGLNTFSFSASVTPVPDVVALGATRSADGVVILPNAAGSNAFSVATVNVGAAGALTVGAELSNPTLPAILSLCQTDPTTGACLNPTAPTADLVNFTAENQGTATFGLFVTATGNVPFDPANNRVFVKFRDSSGTVRGSTSVALRLRTPDDPLPIDTENASAVTLTAMDTLDAATKLMSVAELAIGRLSSARTAPRHEECNPGTVTRTFFDNFLDGLLSAGDRLKVNYDNCNRLSVFEAFVTGDVEVDITASTFSNNEASGYVEGRVRTAGLQIDDEGRIDTLSGELRFTLLVTPTEETYQLTATQNDHLTLSRNGAAEKLSQFTLSRTVSNTLEYRLNFAGQLRSESTIGTYTCNGIELSGAPNRTFPLGSGEMRCFGDAGSLLVATRDEIIVDALGNGALTQVSQNPPWRAIETALGLRVLIGLGPVAGRTNPEASAVAVIETPVRRMVASEATQELFVLHESTLTIIDLADGSVSATQNLPDVGLSLAMSDSGHRLMIGYLNNSQAQPYSVLERTLGIAFDLRDSPTDPAVVAARIIFVPGESDSIIAGLGGDEFNPLTEVVRFDAGVRAPVVAPYTSRIDKFVFDRPDRLIIENNGSLQHMMVDANGVSNDDGARRANISAEGAALFSHNGVIYDTGGNAFSYDDTLIHGFYGSRDQDGDGNGRLGEIDPATNRFYQLTDDEIRVYDLSKFVPLAYWDTPQQLGRFERTASTGTYIVLGGDERIAIIDKAVLSPQGINACPKIDLALFGDTTGTQQIDCAFIDALYAPELQRVVALASSDIGPNGNSVALINPVNAEIESYFYVGSAPKHIELAADGTSAFVALAGSNRVVRINLTNGELSSQAILLNDSNPSFGIEPLFATDIAASPTEALDVIVAYERAEPRLVKNGVITPNLNLGFPFPDKIAFSDLDPTRAYGLKRDDFSRFTVDDNGLTLLSTTEELVEGLQIEVKEGSVYTSERHKLNPETLVVEQDFEDGIRFHHDVSVDTAQSTVMFLSNRSSGPLDLQVFNNETGELVTTLQPPEFGRLLENTFFTKSRLDAQAPDHVIFTSVNGMLIMPKSLIQP